MIIIPILCVLGLAVAEWTPRCNNVAEQYEMLISPNCAGYYICVLGEVVDIHTCPEGSVFSSTIKSCVRKCSRDDDCTPKEACPPQNCSAGVSAVPHQNDCHLYYNCSNTDQNEVQRCRYPLLFSTKTLKCEHFEHVVCGARKEYATECDDPKLHCYKCIPCHVNSPSCKGLPDGPNAYQYRDWSPYYVICRKERTLVKLQCGKGTTSKMKYFFSPEERKCVRLDFRPEHRPKCSPGADSLVADALKRCDHYGVCRNGTYIGYEKCAEGNVFDTKSQSCKHWLQSCAPCGAKTCVDTE